MFKDKKVLVTGGHGMIGRELVALLLNKGAKVTVADISENTNLKGVNYQKIDLRFFDQCLELCKGQDVIFNVVGIKGSPKMCAEQPADFMVPMLQFNTNMMEAAMRTNVEWYLYTSSVGVYQPAEVFKEDDVWSTFPSPNDRFAGWAKRLCELQAEAYKIEHGWDKISIVRPANVYGPFDNFDPANAMVIPSLINRALGGERPLTVWGDGSPIRDFIYSKDVARGMMIAVEKGINEPINLGSGTGVTIKEVAESVAKNIPNEKIDLVWDTSKPKGDAKRLMDTNRAKSYGFECQTSLDKGIKETINWYINNKDQLNNRYNSFTEKLSQGNN